MNDRQYEMNSGNLILFIRRWRNVLLTVSIIAMVSSLVFSFFIKDKYEASVILFPSTTTSISRAILNDENYKEKDYLEFGEEEEAEQMIQILKSDQIRDYIIEKYKLGTHYDLDPSEEFYRTALFNEYESNIDFKRTKFMSVKIEVLDTDPVLAANIANDIADMMDSVKTQMLKQVANQALGIVEDEYNRLLSEINAMEDTLNIIRSFGIQDYESQAEVLTDQYGAALVKNNNQAAAKLKAQLDTLSKYGGKYLSLSQQLEWEREKLSDLRKVYSEAKVNAERQLEQKFVVNRAYAPEKPSYPVRWVIVLVSTLATFLFTLIVLILIDPK